MRNVTAHAVGFLILRNTTSEPELIGLRVGFRDGRPSKFLGKTGELDPIILRQESSIACVL